MYLTKTSYNFFLSKSVMVLKATLFSKPDSLNGERDKNVVCILYNVNI